jgi:hypothetical protein
LFLKVHVGVVRALLAVAAVGACLACVVGVEVFAAHRVRQTAWNVRGYRGRLLGKKAPGEVRIFAVGGSTTFGYTVNRN